MSTKRAGVLGWPISHSKSPRLHGHWLARYGIDGVYEPVAAAPEDFERTVRDLIAKGWAGANVTIPHKEAALDLADSATARAAEIGAANTLVFTPDGEIHADNTDGYGFLENLREGAPENWRPDAPALVIGAGGAARAVIHALAEAGARPLRLVNRTRARAEAMAGAFDAPIEVLDWPDLKLAAEGAGLIVNATALGMGDGAAPDVDLTRAQPGAVATDLVYTPLQTPFLIAAAASGLATVDGLGMLIHQARPGFEAWFGHAPDVDETLRAVMLAS